jgi:hypothetical protein
MNPAALTTNDIAHTILQALVPTRFYPTVEESCAIDEGLRRIDQYGFLLADVIPELQRRLRNLEARTGSSCNPRVELLPALNLVRDFASRPSGREALRLTAGFCGGRFDRGRFRF